MSLDTMPAPGTPKQGDVEALRAHAREIVDVLSDEDVKNILGVTKEHIAGDLKDDADVHRVHRQLLENADHIQNVHPAYDPEGMRRQLLDIGTDEQRLSLFLGLKEEEVHTQMETRHGINGLFEQLKAKRAEVADIDPTLDVAELEEGLQLALDVIQSKEALLKDANSPEKKGMFKKAFDSVRSFPKKHPIVTALLVAALAAGGIAAGFYFTGNWELLLSNLGVAAKESARSLPGVLDQFNPHVPTPLPLNPASPV